MIFERYCKKYILIKTDASLAATTSELLLELLDATRGVHEALLPGKDRVGVRRNVYDEYLMLNTIDSLLLLRALSRCGEKLAACRYVYIGCWERFWVDFSLHCESFF